MKIIINEKNEEVIKKLSLGDLFIDKLKVEFENAYFTQDGSTTVIVECNSMSFIVEAMKEKYGIELIKIKKANSIYD